MTTLFRPVGLHELSLIWDSGMQEFPRRRVLPRQVRASYSWIS
jgi:hypothetical protein